MIENITAHLDTILILVSIFAGYRMIKPDLTEKINGLKEDNTNMEKRLTERIMGVETSIKENIREIGYLKGRLDELFPNNRNKTAA